MTEMSQRKKTARLGFFEVRVMLLFLSLPRNYLFEVSWC